MKLLLLWLLPLLVAPPQSFALRQPRKKPQTSNAEVCATPSAPGQFQFATPGYQFRFPRDYFNHPKFQTEWWYYSGNLKAKNGRPFGFELAFFRFGVAHPQVPKSLWTVRNIYMAHLALSDLEGRHFLYRERLNRAGPGLAGASESRARVWNGNWDVQWRARSEELQTVTNDFSLQLVMKPLKPVVLNGRGGFSRKAPGPGNASNYFSLTRLQTSGSVDLYGKRYRVAGTAWMDHEFFTESSSSPVSGWNWFALQLNNNTELMLYQVRLKGGRISPDSSGTYVAPGGGARHLDRNDFVIIPGATWASPRTRARYPLQWQISVPPLHLQGQVSTPLKNQELVSETQFSPTYWEGAVRFHGEAAGKVVSGVGYLEMTGYAGPADAPRKP